MGIKITTIMEGSRKYLNVKKVKQRLRTAILMHLWSIHLDLFLGLESLDHINSIAPVIMLPSLSYDLCYIMSPGNTEKQNMIYLNISSVSFIKKWLKALLSFHVLNIRILTILKDSYVLVEFSFSNYLVS